MNAAGSIRLRHGSDLEVAVWLRPGRTLDERGVADLVRDMCHVAAEDGKPMPSYGALAGDRSDLAQRIVTIVYLRSTGEPIAFSAMRHLDVEIPGRTESVIHLGLACVHAGHRRRGLVSLLYSLPLLYLFVRNGLRRFWVSNVTQVPAVFGLVAESYAKVFPSPDPRARQTAAHLMLARGIMRDHRAVFGVGHDAGFDEARQIVTNAYTGGSDALKKSFDEAPKHRDPDVNAFCSQALDYDRGDDFLQLAVWNLGAAVRLLVRKTRGAIVRHLIHVALLLAARFAARLVRRPAAPTLAQLQTERA